MTDTQTKGFYTTLLGIPIALSVRMSVRNRTVAIRTMRAYKRETPQPDGRGAPVKVFAGHRNFLKSSTNSQSAKSYRSVRGPLLTETQGRQGSYLNKNRLGSQWLVQNWRKSAIRDIGLPRISAVLALEPTWIGDLSTRNQTWKGPEVCPNAV